ncbi:MAG TPA: interleukin-like EMT inducer domain-containing protein [Candidatus Hydrogenedentes bacterium]|nr:interleukin-like EMT inducer domain-containing protein [Candidatus Hydrogenedentota bacterium]HNT87415.1 interleukin-like EMT inducer domain-containing protein [Candidatus Hydrogenedentota bacterium]
MTPFTRIVVLWAVTAACFAAFNAAYWPLNAHRVRTDPANFTAYAQRLEANGRVQDAIAALERGIAAFRPSCAAPYEQLLRLYAQAGDLAAHDALEPTVMFRAALENVDPDRRDAMLRDAARARLQQDKPPGVAPVTAEALQRFAVNLTAVYGAGRAILDMGFEEHFALLSIAGGEFRTDGIIGETGVACPVDILVQSGGGQGVQRAAHIVVNGRDYARRERGIHVVLFDPATAEVLHWDCFDLYDDATAAQRLARLLHRAPEGCIGAFAVFDDGSVNMTEELEIELLRFGLERAALVDRAPALVGLRHSLAAIGVKGAPRSSALQAWAPERFETCDGHPVACGVLRPWGAAS